MKIIGFNRWFVLVLAVFFAGCVTTKSSEVPDEPEQKVAAATTVVDTDGDGFPDNRDGCVNRAEDKDGFDDKDGCPDLDNDGDGINDEFDKCPNAAEDKDGFEDADGCPDADNDGDGVPDAADACPNQPEDLDGHQDSDGCIDADNDGDGIHDCCDGAPGDPEVYNGYLDKDGIPDSLPAPVVINNIAPGRGTLDAFANQSLGDVASILKENKTLTAVVEGHTDSQGDAGYNKSLSRKRANTVKNILINKYQLSKYRVKAVGLGEAKPVASNKTAAGRAKNRRIVIKITQ